MTKMKFIRIPVLGLLVLVSTGTFSQDNNETGNNQETSKEVRNLQVSFLPFISFNSSPANSTVNYSVNILGGYVKEVRVLELGSIINIDGNNAGKCQLAGVGNVVGGTSSGLQSAGVFNYATRQNGIQASGVFNVVTKDAGMSQLAGVANIVGDSSAGLQAAGVFNYATAQNGVQLGGVFNVAAKNAGICQLAGVTNITAGACNGFQGAGVMNVAKTVKGAQVAGVLNTVFGDTVNCQLAGVGNVTGGAIDGIQAAGVFNYATKVTGAQISGVLNVAPYIKGTQISLINISDSCQGVPIGFLSFVAKGYHQLEFSADEIFYTNLAFRTGTRYFHNIFMAGIRPGNFGSPLWTVGYGVGTLFGNPDGLSYNIDLTSQQVSKGRFSQFESQLCKLYVGVDKKIAPFASLDIGITYNFYIIGTHSKYYNSAVSEIPLYTLSDHTYHNGINIKTWIGGKIAIRFF